VALDETELSTIQPAEPSGGTLAPGVSRSFVGALVALARRIFLEVGVLPLLLVALVIVFGAVEPRFLSTDNLFNVSRQASFLVIIAVGQALVLMSGGFDLSVGGTVALTSVVTATVMSGQVDDGAAVATAIVLGVLAGLLVGFLVGLANGFAVAALKVQPFVVTLAMSSITVGVALMISNGAPVGGIPREFTSNFGTGKLWGVGVSVWFALGLAVLVAAAMARTRFGRYVYAIGGNARAARLSGVSVWRTTWAVYVLCSFLTAVAGVLLTARVSSGEPNLGGSFALESIAAGVLGGVAIGGGEGRISGALGGAIFVVMLQNGLNLTQVADYVQMIVIGVVLVVAVVIDRLRTSVRRAS